MPIYRIVDQTGRDYNKETLEFWQVVPHYDTTNETTNAI